MKQLGKQIREHRKSLGANQQTIADLAGISINTMTRIEQGDGGVSLQKLYAVLEVLGLELNVQIKNREISS